MTQTYHAHGLRVKGECGAGNISIKIIIARATRKQKNFSPLNKSNQKLFCGPLRQAGGVKASALPMGVRATGADWGTDTPRQFLEPERLEGASLSLSFLSVKIASALRDKLTRRFSAIMGRL